MAVAMLCCMSSCLDEEPLYTQNNKNVFSTEDNIELALLGCYAYMAHTGAYGQHWQEVPVVGGGLAWAQRTGSDGLVSLNTLSSDGLVSTAWSGMYKVISEANAFLSNLEQSGMSEEIKVQYGGEAKFLRALAYYNLVSMFGDIPLKTTASTSDGISTPRSPKETIFEQIISDLTDAQKISEDVEDGRASSWTVKAFLGKVYYKMAALGIDADKNWNNAKTCFDDVYKNGPYELEPNFYDLFTDWKTGSKEAIFQINFSLTSGACFNRASNRFAPQASTAGVNWSTYRSTKSAYDLHEGTYPGDPRIDATFLTRWRKRGGNSQANPSAQVGDKLSANDSVYTYPYMTYTVKIGKTEKDGKIVYEYDSIQANGKNKAARIFVAKMPYEAFSDRKNPSISVMESWPDAEDQSNMKDTTLVYTYRNVRKTFVTKNDVNQMPAFAKTLYDQAQQGTASHKNLIVYRYAEMLLLMADVYNELGQTSEAIKIANEVLDRARKSHPLTVVAATESSQPADWPLTLSQEEVREKLYFERYLELNGEPDIYDMVRIRGVELFRKLLEFNNSHELTRLSDEFYYESPGANKWCERVYNGGNLTDDYVKKNLLLPIPDTERDANPEITDNNFGY